MKKTLSICLVISLLFLYTACSQQSQGQNAASPSQASGSSAATSAASSAAPENAKEGEIQLRMSWWGGDARHAKYNEILDLYESQNPNVKIIREYGGNYWERLATNVAGGNAPDIIQMWNPYFPLYATNDVMVDLSGYFDSGVISREGWDDGIAAQGEYNGVPYEAVLGVNATGMFYNETMIRAAGMEPPKNGMTWDEFAEFCRQLKPHLPDGTYPACDPFVLAEYFYSWVRHFNGNIVTDDGKQLAVANEDIQKHLDYWKMMRDEGLSPPATVLAEEKGKMFEEHLFTRGKVATFFLSSNQLDYYQRINQDSIGWVRMPALKDSKNPKSEFFMVVGLGIAKSSPNADEAAKLINWFVNDKQAQLIYNLEMGTPANTEVLDWLEETGQLTEKLRIPAEFMLDIAKDTPLTIMINPMLPSVAENEWSKCIEEAVFETKPYNQIIDEFVTSANTRLSGSK